MSSNGLRMPIAEWLYRMSEAGVPYQARTLAIYAALFNVTGNDELSRLCGLAGRTYDRWKKFLVDEGWVIVTQRSGGRGRGVEVHPAMRETPVTFTDVSRKNPRNYYPRNIGETPAKMTGVKAEVTPVNSAPVSSYVVETASVSSETPAEVTPVNSAPPSRARIETPSGLHISNSNTTSHTHHLDAAREGERDLGHGVFVNCETVRHRDFTINLAAVEMQLLGHAGKITREQIRDFAAGQALQWATELENGTIKKSGLPRQIARSVAGYLTNHLNQQDAVKGRGGWFGRDSRTAGASGMSEAERAARLRMIENT